MDNKRLDDEIASIEQRQQVLFAKKKVIDDELVVLYNRLERIKNQVAEQRIKLSPVNWTWLLETYPECKVKYDELSKQVRALGLNYSGFWREINQYAIQIALSRTDKANNNKQLEGLKVVLPFIKEQEGQGKTIDILEYTLSQYCSYKLHIYSDTDVKIHNGYSIEKTCTSLEEAFDYISRVHYYD